MALQNTDQQAKMVEVTDINDVTGPMNVSPAGYAIGWRAHVRSAVVTSNNRTFVVVLDQATNAHTWLEQLTSAASVVDPPDQRFTVAPAGYNLANPGVATFQTIQAGLNEAQSPTVGGVTLGAASTTSRRLVEVEPSTYDEQLTSRAFCGLRGMGSSPADTVIANSLGVALTITTAANDESHEIENLTIRGPIVINETAGLTGGKIVFRRVIFDNTGAQPSTLTRNCNAASAPEVVFEECSGTFASFTASGSGGSNTNFLKRQLPLQSPDLLAQAGKLGSAGIFSIIAAQSNIVQVTDRAYLVSSAVGGADILSLTGSGSYIVVLSDSDMDTNGALGTVVLFNSPGNASVQMNHISLDSPVTAVVQDAGLSGNVNVSSSDYVFKTQTAMASSARALVGLTGGSQSESLPEPRIYASRRYGTFVVPPAAGFGNGYFLNNPPNGGAPAFDFARMIHSFIADYGNPSISGAIQPDTSLPLFRFALFQLPDPSEFEDGRVLILKNLGNPATGSPNLNGPVAISLANGTSQIENKDSRPTVNPLLTSANYIILSPQDSVTLVVDRTGTPGTLQYRVIGNGS